MWCKHTAGLAVRSAPSCHSRPPSSCELLEAVSRLSKGQHAHRRANVCCVHAPELASAYPIASEPSEAVIPDSIASDSNAAGWDVEDIARLSAKNSEERDIVLQRLQAVLHTLNFQQTFEVYKELSKVLSKLPSQKRQHLCNRLQQHPTISNLHHRFESTLIEAHEDDIASLAVTLARAHASHYPASLGSMLLAALDTAPQPTPKLKALVLHACAKTNCQGVRKRLLSRVVNSALQDEFENWDLQSLSMYVQSLYAFGYTSKITYRQAAKAALECCQQPTVLRDVGFMKSLALLLWALAKADRTMSAPASELFSIAANELIASSQRVRQPSDQVSSSVELDTSRVRTEQHTSPPGKSSSSTSTAPSKHQTSLTATHNMQDCSQLLWALATAAQARIKQNHGVRDNEWRGSPRVNNSTATSAHPSMTSRSEELLKKHWGEVPVVEAVTATLDAIAHEGTPIKSERAIGGLLWVCASLSIFHEPFLAHACRNIDSSCHTMTPRAASTCLWALGRLAYYPHATISKLASHMATGKQSNKSMEDKERRGSDSSAANTLVATDRSSGETPVATHYGSRFSDECGLSLVRSLTQGLHACATLGAEGSAVKALCSRTLQHLQLMLLERGRLQQGGGYISSSDSEGDGEGAPPGREAAWHGSFQALTLACWSAVILDCHHDKELMAPLLLEALSQGDKLKTVELAQLAQVDLAMRLEVAWYSERAWLEDGQPADLLAGLYWLGSARSKVTHNWLWKPMGARSVISKFQASVQRSLRRMGHSTVSEASVGGLSVDIWLPKLGIAVEVDGPMHFAANDHMHVLGATRLKRRLLSALGAIQVSVSFFEWPQVDSEQSCFLRQLLRQAALEQRKSHAESPSSEVPISTLTQIPEPWLGAQNDIESSLVRDKQQRSQKVHSEVRSGKISLASAVDNRSGTDNDSNNLSPHFVQHTQRVWGLAGSDVEGGEPPSWAGVSPYIRHSDLLGYRQNQSRFDRNPDTGDVLPPAGRVILKMTSRNAVSLNPEHTQFERSHVSEERESAHADSIRNGAFSRDNGGSRVSVVPQGSEEDVAHVGNAQAHRNPEVRGEDVMATGASDHMHERSAEMPPSKPEDAAGSISDAGVASGVPREEVASGVPQDTSDVGVSADSHAHDREACDSEAPAIVSEPAVARNARQHDMLRFAQGKLSKRRLLEKAALRNVRSGRGAVQDRVRDAR